MPWPLSFFTSFANVTSSTGLLTKHMRLIIILLLWSWNGMRASVGIGFVQTRKLRFHHEGIETVLERGTHPNFS
ncbi:hypothetical protein KIN20_015610 [Parelaphostrongylus tenuis]|uniref:Uncharacterized protein n=1 Tax=Parelaphostrongylus tenuis TaxID=148309 RepID=A0AAD5MGC1_PARTN|nr:hypothetical protein KIN20_015610 [Parelaphostrongylus tenuis]